MPDAYRVIYAGSLDKGVAVEHVAKKLVQEYKLSEPAARQLLATVHDVTLKSGLKLEVAARYYRALSGIGMRVRVERECTKNHANLEDQDAEFSGRHVNGVSEVEVNPCPYCGAELLADGACSSCIVGSSGNASLAGTYAKNKRKWLSAGRIFRYLFPPLSKTAVFVMAVMMYTAFMYVQWAPSPLDLILSVWMVTPGYPEEPLHFIFVQLIYRLLMTLVVLVVLVGPLVMPFVKNDLRGASFLVVSLFLMASIAYGVVGVFNNPDAILNKLVLAYSMLWGIYLMFIGDYSGDMGYLVEDDKPEILSPILAATVALVVVHVMTRVFSVFWVNAFVVAVTTSASIVPFLVKSVALPLFRR